MASSEIQNDKLINSIRRSLKQLIIDDGKDEIYYRQFFVNPLTTNVFEETQIPRPSSIFNTNKAIDIESKPNEMCVELELMEPMRENHILFEEFAVIYGFATVDRLPKYQPQKPVLKSRERTSSSETTDSSRTTTDTSNTTTSTSRTTISTSRTTISSNGSSKFCHICFIKMINICNEYGSDEPDLHDPDAPWNNHRSEENGIIACPQWFFYGYPECLSPRESSLE